ncbi:D-methionine transport system ATP-binding protein [Duganella sp. CF402]|uniref:methionine ABC transporter ATP-binding protein n=1 Tax=unclassified Duganella TaxID=2636909 RepID=UPI0008D04C7A|nr:MULTISPECIES: methionine ABC transporter ATP-binding protein [unclassified Duganella]RZT09925.1 D-methionine transport system ATP-binding protein [Duganella sp. BK701]SEL36818.1 D-methionine transport system ATP-binding protein [Duganella sp. CF402]
MTTPLIRIEHASKAFGDFHAVRDVSLDVAQGDIFGLIGKSGAGKSTLLRLINLLERPDDGAITVDGRELTSLSKRDLRDARANIGMIFQQFNLLQNASVFENVAFPLRIHGGRSKQQIAARVADCLELVGLSDKSASYPAQLSGGQKQRVAIARALASGPAVLLCDEPTSALDAETTRALLATLKDINQRLDVTIVIVSHELDVIGEICNRVAVIEDGAIAEQFALDDATSLSAPRRTALGRELAAAVAARTPAATTATAPRVGLAPAADNAHLVAASAANTLAARAPLPETAHV